MKIIGIPVSSGISMNNVYKLADHKIHITKELITDIDLELLKFHNALEISIIELEQLRLKAEKRLQIADLEVFKSHKLIVADPLIIEEVEGLIKNRKYNAGYAYKKVIDRFLSTFKSMKNEYMSERAIDIKDVYQRVLSVLTHKQLNTELVMTKEVILIANDITPSQVLSLNIKLVKGIILKQGGKTSHSSIMIKSLGVPLIIGIKDQLNNVFSGEFVIMDGALGEIILSPTSTEISEYVSKQKIIIEEEKKLRNYISKTTISKDGIKVPIYANINSGIEVDFAVENGAEGIGLFRTEYVYLNNENLPTENELFMTYNKVLSAFPNQIVLIRTLDIGGDKTPKYIKFKKIDKLRGLALSLSNKLIFKTQIRALLRANTEGNLSIMFPMVESLSKLAEAKNLVEICKTELLSENIVVNQNYRLGIMVEEIDVANNLNDFIKEVDFISIGTNDLSQSMFKTDRSYSNNGNNKHYLDKKFIEVIKHIIDVSRKYNTPSSMCGEMADDLEAIPKLLKLGLNSLSVTPKDIPKIRYLISEINIKK